MSKELELEAEKYGYDKNGIISEQAHAFIKGAESKYVEKQKIQFAINQLMWVNILIPFDYKYAKDCIENKVKELKQQLNNEQTK